MAVRFASVSEADVDASIVPARVENTDAATRTAVNAFQSWMTEKLFLDDLSTISNERLNELVPRFILEARKANGDPYPATSLKNYVSGLQRHLRILNPSFGHSGSLLSGSEFKRIQTSLDNRFKQLTAAGFKPRWLLQLQSLYHLLKLAWRTCRSNRFFCWA